MFTVKMVIRIAYGTRAPHFMAECRYCRQTSNISSTLVGNKIVDHSDVVGATPDGAVPITSSSSTRHLASMGWPKTTARRDEKNLVLGDSGPYIRGLMVLIVEIQGPIIFYISSAMARDDMYLLVRSVSVLTSTTRAGTLLSLISATMYL